MDNNNLITDHNLIKTIFWLRSLHELFFKCSLHNLGYMSKSIVWLMWHPLRHYALCSPFPPEFKITAPKMSPPVCWPYTVVSVLLKSVLMLQVQVMFNVICANRRQRVLSLCTLSMSLQRSQSNLLMQNRKRISACPEDCSQSYVSFSSSSHFCCYCCC